MRGTIGCRCSNSRNGMAIAFTSILAYYFPLRLEYLTWPRAILLLALCSIPVLVLGMHSLNGLGPVRKWVAIAIRLLVLLIFVLIIGGARWQRTNHDLEV